MPGIFAVPQHAPIGKIIDDLYVLTLASELGEWEAQVVHF